jgi:hypothetical protein
MNQQKPETAEADELRGQIKSWEVLYDSSLADRLVLLAGLSKVRVERNALRGDLAHAEDELDDLFTERAQAEAERDALRVRLDTLAEGDPAEVLRKVWGQLRHVDYMAFWQDLEKVAAAIDAATKPSPKEGP